MYALNVFSPIAVIKLIAILVRPLVFPRCQFTNFTLFALHLISKFAE